MMVQMSKPFLSFQCPRAQKQQAITENNGIKPLLILNLATLLHAILA